MPAARSARNWSRATPSASSSRPSNITTARSLGAAAGSARTSSGAAPSMKMRIAAPFGLSAPVVSQIGCIASSPSRTEPCARNDSSVQVHSRFVERRDRAPARSPGRRPASPAASARSSRTRQNLFQRLPLEMVEPDVGHAATALASRNDRARADRAGARRIPTPSSGSHRWTARPSRCRQCRDAPTAPC